MKLRYIIPSFIALVAMFASCSDDNDPTYLDEVKVSQSIVTLPTEGGKVTITVNASSDWQFEEVFEETVTDEDGNETTVKYAIPEWLSVSQTSGGAGVTEITFSADEATENHNVELKISCAGKTQRINVIQQAEETEPVIYTVAEAVAMIKAKQQPESAVYVKGIVCRIQEISVQYGNATYFLSDDGKYSADGVWLEVYRGYWLNGQKFTEGNEFGVGDEMVIKGVLIDYQGTPETNQGTCEVVSINKSLIGIDGVELLGAEEGEGEGVTEFPLEGGAIKVNINTKGNGFHVVIPEEAKSWLHIDDFGADYVTLKADENTGGDRSVTVGFTTEADGTTYSCEQSFTQKGAIVAVSIAEFNAAEVGETQYRLSGIITKIANSSYGNYYIRDYSGETYVYGTGDKGYFETLGLKEGDIVTIVGKRDEYKGTIEVVNSVIEETISVVPVTVEEFLSKEDSKDVYYMVTGDVKEIVNTTYGNLYLTDGTNDLYVYGCYPGWGASGDNRKNLMALLEEEDNAIEVGDKLTVIGVKSTYNDAPQVNGGIYFSHEKAE